MHFYFVWYLDWITHSWCMLIARRSQIECNNIVITISDLSYCASLYKCKRQDKAFFSFYQNYQWEISVLIRINGVWLSEEFKIIISTLTSAYSSVIYMHVYTYVWYKMSSPICCTCKAAGPLLIEYIYHPSVYFEIKGFQFKEEIE